MDYFGEDGQIAPSFLFEKIFSESVIFSLPGAFLLMRRMWRRADMTDEDFKICVDRHIKMVYRIAFHYLGRREDAEDEWFEMAEELLM